MEICALEGRGHVNLRELLGNAIPWMPSTPQVERLEAVRLPRDERPHHSKMEWWHFMGYVEPRPTAAETDDKIKNDETEEQRTKRKKALREKREAKRTTFVMSILRGQIQQMSHLGSIVILMDHERKAYTTSVKLGAMQSSYFELQDGRAFRFHFGPQGPSRLGPPEAWSATGGMGIYTLAIDTAKQLALELEQSTPAVFPGPKGIYNYDDQRKMAYYLWPSLEVEGVQGVGADEQAVTGQAWMEHQWGDVPIGDYRWRYLAVIIEEGDYVGRWLFFMTETRGGNKNKNDSDTGGPWQAFWIKPNGSVERVEAHEAKDSSTLHDVYPLISKLRVSGEKVDSMAPVPTPTTSQQLSSDKEFTLLVEPVHLHQECNPKLPGGLIPAFWEGACDVYVVEEGKPKEKVGWAVMELAGYR
jgi:hypothetical protein